MTNRPHNSYCSVPTVLLYLYMYLLTPAHSAVCTISFRPANTCTDSICLSHLLLLFSFSFASVSLILLIPACVMQYTNPSRCTMLYCTVFLRAESGAIPRVLCHLKI
ncbi:hypothetical protein F4803DRAFT_36865 [Xylaria telfairii]|nr:hypothetical protein F4803DRAFT_36865 [Xylaria telfairii]